MDAETRRKTLESFRWHSGYSFFSSEAYHQSLGTFIDGIGLLIKSELENFISYVVRQKSDKLAKIEFTTFSLCLQEEERKISIKIY
uniref:Uncharacterized protein n=1 Tax=Strongyloides venezuelensis TaxID=75913 RepID=A0A0K0FFZ3_STRVS